MFDFVMISELWTGVEWSSKSHFFTSKEFIECDSINAEFYWNLSKDSLEAKTKGTSRLDFRLEKLSK